MPCWTCAWASISLACASSRVAPLTRIRLRPPLVVGKCVLATYRDTEAGDSLRAALAELAREPSVTRIRLTGLTEDEVAAQLAGVTGWAVPDSVAAAVCRRTQGNPFFVGELGRLLTDGRDGELPDGVRDAVRGRLARLSPRVPVDRVGGRGPRLGAGPGRARRRDRPRAHRRPCRA
jgi:hypothetical protein